MAKFKTLCPHCQAEIHVYSQWAGQLAVCSSCNETITVPPLENNSVDAMPRITTCPSCRSTQVIPAEISDRSKRSCTKCGSSFLYMPDISFKCADKLPPDQNGNARIACPYCGRHYVLKYSPHNSLIGCQECMNIFANPDAAQPQVTQKKMPRLIPAPIQQPVQAPGPIPIPPRPAAQFSADSSIKLKPKPQTDDDIKFQPLPQDHIQLKSRPQGQPRTAVPQPQEMPTLLLQPAFPTKPGSNQPAADDQEEEMVEIQHRIYNEPPTVVLAAEEQPSDPKTVADKSLIRKFFGL